MADDPNAAPQEFTPEIDQAFRNRLAYGIQQQGAADQGQARSDALARGLTGDPFEASAVGAARNNTSNQLNSLDSGLAYENAGLQRDERLRTQARGWQVQDQSNASALQTRLAQMGYANQNQMQQNIFKHENSQAPWSLAAGIAGSAAGAYSGGLAKGK